MPQQDPEDARSYRRRRTRLLPYPQDARLYQWARLQRLRLLRDELLKTTQDEAPSPSPVVIGDPQPPPPPYNYDHYPPLGVAQDEAPSPVVIEDPQQPPQPSEKLVVAVADSASVQTLQETNISSLVELLNTTSLEESITASPGTGPHNNTIDGSSSSSPFSWKKFVVGTADPSSAQPLQEGNVSSSEELLDATSTEEPIIASQGAVPHKTMDGSSSSLPFSCEKLVADVAESAAAQTLQESDVSSLVEFLDSSSEESITAGRRAEPHNPIDASSITFPLRCESASSQTLQEPDLSSLEEFLDTTSEESMTSSPRTAPRNTNAGSPTSASSLGSKILFRSPPNWYEVFYIRMNHGGSFCMYPDLGGPFLSVEAAENAIERHLCELQRGAWCKEQDNFNIVDRMVHNCKYYLDGCTPRRGLNSPNYDEKRYLVQALLDQYTDEHNLFGNLELEDILKRQWFLENRRTFFHFNFRTKKKEGDDNPSAGKLFFAEVVHTGYAWEANSENAWEVNCCCPISDEDNGLCYGCKLNGSPNMKHPNNIHAYTGGHLNECMPFEYDESSSSEDEEDEDTRLRNMFEGLDDPDVWDYLFPNTRSVEVKDLEDI